MASTNKHVFDWTFDDVATWLRDSDMDQFIELFTVTHKIDGSTLLTITEADLRLPPLQLTVLGDIKRMSMALEKLRQKYAINLLPPANNDDDEESANSSDYANDDTASPTLLAHKPFNGPVVLESPVSSESLIARIEALDTERKSTLKTLLAFGYCSLAFLLTSFIMVIVHDRVPDMKTYPPLPDIVLDNIPLISWAFEVCEMLACILALVWFIVLIFHRHRLILMRRMFSLTGTVFLLRCFTMLITSLSVPGVHLECTAKSYGDIYAKLEQAFKIWYGMGMSLRGVRTCGDYMFSGHTTVVTLLNHFITEYTPDDWKNLHTASWVINLFSIFFILAGHEHYSIDVFVAFYISSRLFLYYHTMAYHAQSLAYADSRTRSWFPLFWFFESGGHLGRIPNEYGIPFVDELSTWWKYRQRDAEAAKKHGSTPGSTVTFQLGSVPNDVQKTNGCRNGTEKFRKKHSPRQKAKAH